MELLKHATVVCTVLVILPIVDRYTVSKCYSVTKC